MKEVFEVDELIIDYSKITPLCEEPESLLICDELMDKYAMVIDESQIEKIIETLPEEQKCILTFDEKIELVKDILAYDVSVPIKNLFDDVISFVSVNLK